jgi:hypothetical protein
VDAITADAGLAVTRIDGHGTVTLPPEYVRDHLQLGYAATEPGNQSDTATRSLTLATAATTGRGLYVAATRGRDANLILVVTDSHDLRDAVDTLEQILASDRADIPATSVRRELAAAVPPAPVLEPRCVVPDWLHDLHHGAGAALAEALARVDAEQRADNQIQQRIDELARQLQQIAPNCAPHDHALADVNHDLEHARRHHRQAERNLADSGYLRRRAARIEIAEAAEQVTAASTALADLTRRAQPLLDQRKQLRSELERLHVHANGRSLLRGLDQNEDRVHAAEQTTSALDVWKEWAIGRPVHPARLVDAAAHLRMSQGADQVALSGPLVGWLEQQGIVQSQPAIERTPPRIEPPGVEIGF